MCWSRPERRAALAAELVRGRVSRLARRTGRRKACAALPAELHSCGILVLALGTTHHGLSLITRALPTRSAASSNSLIPVPGQHGLSPAPGVLAASAEPDSTASHRVPALEGPLTDWAERW